MLKSPSCRRQIKVLWGTFLCRWCGEKLHWDLGLFLVECSLLGVIALFVPCLIAWWVLPGEDAPRLAGLLALLLEVPICAVFIFVRVAFFPSPVKKDSGWPDDGTILHITSPPQPPKDS